MRKQIILQLKSGIKLKVIFALSRNAALITSNQPTEKVMKYIKKTKEKSEYVTVPKQFKTNEFQNAMFLKPSSYYKYIGDNLQRSVVNTPLRNSITKFKSSGT